MCWGKGKRKGGGVLDDDLTDWTGLEWEGRGGEGSKLACKQAGRQVGNE